MLFDGRSIFITGGTGSIGKAVITSFLGYPVKKITVYSRDEYKQWELENELPDPRIHYRLGDVRDLDRLSECVIGHDIVVHAAALKQVPRGETDPSEFIKTNVGGTENVIKASLQVPVKRLVFLSTDKAVSPTSNYGSSKLSAERLVIQAASQINASVVRFGNVMGSRGTVVPFFLESRKKGYFPVTNLESTRFHLTSEHAVSSIVYALTHSLGGEIIIPKLRSFRLQDLVNAIDAQADRRIIGLRKGERLHEVLMSDRESQMAIEVDDFYVVLPDLDEPKKLQYVKKFGGRSCSESFHYNSNNPSLFLNVEELKKEVFAEKEIIQKTKV